MPTIDLVNVTKRWGDFYAVDNLNLHIDDYSFITFRMWKNYYAKNDCWS